MAVRKGYNRFFIIFQEEDKGFGIAIDKQPTGYAKIEVRNGKCKITVYVQNLKREKAPYYFCMMDTVKPPPLLVRLGEIKIDDAGRGETWWEYNEENIADTSKSVDKLNTAIILAEGQSFPSPLLGFTGKEKPVWRELLQTKEDEKISEIEHSEVEDQVLSRNSDEEKSEEASKAEEITVLDEEGTRFKEYEESLRLQVENSNLEDEASDAGEMDNSNELETPKEAQQELERGSETELEIPATEEEEQDVRIWEQPIVESKLEPFRHENDKEEHHHKWAHKFHDVLMEYEEIENPFEDDDEATRWWKIPYKSSIRIPDEEHYPFISTIFHLNMIYPYIDYIKYFYNRGYYYFGIKYDEDKEVKYIIYGIEGNPVLREQPCMGMTGFYKCIKLKNRNMGAWIMVYNPRTGNFMLEKNI